MCKYLEYRNSAKKENTHLEYLVGATCAAIFHVFCVPKRHAENFKTLIIAKIGPIKKNELSDSIGGLGIDECALMLCAQEIIVGLIVRKF